MGKVIAYRADTTQLMMMKRRTTTTTMMMMMIAYIALFSAFD